jgi:hypothetical protein
MNRKEVGPSGDVSTTALVNLLSDLIEISCKPNSRTFLLFSFHVKMKMIN